MNELIDEEFASYFGNKRLGFASGCFDLLHFYHYHYLVRCKALCDFLLVGIDADSLVRLNKGKSPQIPEYHRASMVEALKCVDGVVILRDISEHQLLSEMSDVVFKNSPTIYGKELIAPEKTIIIPDVEEVQSTTELIRKIGDSHVKNLQPVAKKISVKLSKL